MNVGVCDTIRKFLIFWFLVVKKYLILFVLLLRFTKETNNGNKREKTRLSQKEIQGYSGLNGRYISS